MKPQRKAHHNDTAQRMCRHTIVYVDMVEKLVVARSMAGRTTASIAAEFGLSESQVAYRVKKAQDSLGQKFRAEYRHGTTPLARAMAYMAEGIGLKAVTRTITPKFRPFARSGDNGK